MFKKDILFKSQLSMFGLISAVLTYHFLHLEVMVAVPALVVIIFISLLFENKYIIKNVSNPVLTGFMYLLLVVCTIVVMEVGLFLLAKNEYWVAVILCCILIYAYHIVVEKINKI